MLYVYRYVHSTGLYTGFLPRGGELGVCQKEGGVFGHIPYEE